MLRDFFFHLKIGFLKVEGTREGGNKIVLMADYGVGDYANSTWLLAVSAAHCEVSLRVATFNEIFHPIKGE